MDNKGKPFELDHAAIDETVNATYGDETVYVQRVESVIRLYLEATGLSAVYRRPGHGLNGKLATFATVDELRDAIRTASDRFMNR